MEDVLHQNCGKDGHFDLIYTMYKHESTYSYWRYQLNSFSWFRSKEGAVVKALAFNCCVFQFRFPDLPGVTCGFSLLLDLILVPMDFLPLQKQTLNSNSTWNQWARSHFIDVPLLNPIYFSYSHGKDVALLIVLQVISYSLRSHVGAQQC